MSEPPSPKTPQPGYAPAATAGKAKPTGWVQGSTRRLSRGRRVWYAIVIALARGVLRFFWSTCRIERVVGGEHLEGRLERGEPSVVCYWHQMHLFGSHYLFGLSGGGGRIGYLISPSVSGEVPAAIARGMGVEVLRGSTTRSGGRALRDTYMAIKRRGISLVITADGPKGPLHEFKPGAILLAKMTGAPIVPVAYAARHAWHVHTWDRFIIPRPGSGIAIAVGAPIEIPGNTSLDEIQPIQRQLEEAMSATVARAQEALEAPES